MAQTRLAVPLVALCLAAIGCASRSEIHNRITADNKLLGLPENLSAETRTALNQMTVAQIKAAADANPIIAESVGDKNDARAKAIAEASKASPSAKAALSAALAKNPGDATLLPAVADITKANDDKATKQIGATESFLGTNFSVGAGASIDAGGRRRVSDASVEGGVVRVKSESTEVPRVLLELHHFFPITEAGDVGVGPFACVQSSGDSNLIDGLGIGAMTGFMVDSQSKKSLNIGIGAILDFHTKVLGDGIQNGMPLPATETTVRFKEITRASILVAISFSW